MEKNVAGNIKSLWFYLTRNNCLALVLSEVEEAKRTKKGMWKGVVVVPIVSWKTTRSGRLVVSREGQSKLFALMTNYWLLHGNQSKQGESLDADLALLLWLNPLSKIHPAKRTLTAFFFTTKRQARSYKRSEKRLHTYKHNAAKKRPAKSWLLDTAVGKQTEDSPIAH